MTGALTCRVTGNFAVEAMQGSPRGEAMLICTTPTCGICSGSWDQPRAGRGETQRTSGPATLTRAAALVCRKAGELGELPAASTGVAPRQFACKEAQSARVEAVAAAKPPPGDDAAEGDEGERNTGKRKPSMRGAQRVDVCEKLRGTA